MSVCRWCKTDNLSWREVEGRWRLCYPNGTLHLCITTRTKIAKHIPKPNKELEKRHAIEDAKPWKPPPEDYRDPWYKFLDGFGAS